MEPVAQLQYDGRLYPILALTPGNNRGYVLATMEPRPRWQGEPIAILVRGADREPVRVSGLLDPAAPLHLTWIY